MKKLILAIIVLIGLCCLFSSCVCELEPDRVFIIDKIKYREQGKSLYIMSDRDDARSYTFKIRFIDSANKFSVGDTVYLSN